MRVLMACVAATLAVMSTSARAETAAATMCGRPADMVQIVIEQQKPSVVSLWRDQKLFVNRDNDDGSVWVFSLQNTTVHPAAICRRTVKDADGKETIENGQLCTAGEKACTHFAAQVAERLAKIDAGTR
ncbi:MAG: hypothetical protein NW216_14170 [Hyphomicrobium sp.]|nr:hypothetical protein [Hyphomicrobium sp.]